MTFQYIVVEINQRLDGEARVCLFKLRPVDTSITGQIEIGLNNPAETLQLGDTVELDLKKSGEAVSINAAQVVKSG